jgi:hypothetical protein
LLRADSTSSPDFCSAFRESAELGAEPDEFEVSCVA